MNYFSSLLAFLFLICIPVLGIGQRKVACIGDSVTEGYGIPNKNSRYPSILQDLLGEAYIVGNFGHSGATLLQKGHNPYNKTKAYQDALAFEPDIIVIALGLNDTDPRNWPNYHNDFESDYADLIADFREINPNVEVYVCSMTPIFSGHRRFLSGTRDWFDRIQSLIPQIVAANNTHFIDNHAVLAARIDLFDDHLHPNGRGAELIAENVAKSIHGVRQPLSLAKTFGSHMVLQRNVENSLRGLASSGDKLTVHLCEEIFHATANKRGEWTVTLPARAAGGPYDITVKSNSGKIVLSDVLFGDVFLASGQSNMAFTLRQALRGDEVLAQMAPYAPQIRLFKDHNLIHTNHVAWDTTILDAVNELQYFQGEWEVASAESAADFSAIAYSAAAEIARLEGVPVGIIDLSVGGSNTESWISRRALEQDNLLASYIHNWRTSDFIQDFCRTRGAKNLELSKVKHQRHPYEPAYNYEAGLQHWLGTNFKAVLWYQGESNAHNIELHDHLFRTLIQSWRTEFEQNLPFYFVQLSSIERPSWPAFRDAQRQLANALPNVYMAVSSDLGDPTDVHPREKIVIGKRLAQLIRQHEYGVPVQGKTPQVVSYKKVDGGIELTFGNCTFLRTKNNEGIRGLQLLDHRGKVIPINRVRINQKTLIIDVNPETVKKVQYAYQPYTTANLESDWGIPVSTFSLTL